MSSFRFIFCTQVVVVLVNLDYDQFKTQNLLDYDDWVNYYQFVLAYVQTWDTAYARKRGPVVQTALRHLSRGNLDMFVNSTGKS